MYIVTAKEMYDIDRYTIEELGLPGTLLMENAGREIYKRIVEVTKKCKKFIVFVGPGNNGGDGFVIARYLLDEGKDVKVVQVVSNEKVLGDAALHKKAYVNSGGVVQKYASFSISELQQADVIIDSLLGIGVKGDLRHPYKEIVQSINEAEGLVISVDTPSGLPIDLVQDSFTAVKADYTFVVGAAKISAFLQETSYYYGEWDIVNIGFSKKTMQKFTQRSTYEWDDFKRTIPKRNSYAHKGDHGKGLIIGGSADMPGSIMMTTKASLVAGSGLITAATVEEVIPVIASYSPEAMMRSLKSKNGKLIRDENLTLSVYDAIALGIGVGRDEETGMLVRDVLEKATCPVIVDADGLYHLAHHLEILFNRNTATIITPHAGEMARLLDVTVEELERDRFDYTREFAIEHGVYVLLKGKHTIITAPDGRQAVDSTGNSGLAKGGSGDVLTGIILAQVLQSPHLFTAICNACFIHGTSADIAVSKEKTIYDLVATDVIRYIGQVYRTISD